MKSRIIVIAILLMPFYLYAQAPVIYNISFPNRDHHEAQVSVTFAEVPAGPLQVRMSRTSPGRYALHEFAKNVYNVNADDAKGKPLNITRPNLHEWDINRHNGTVKISYTIYGDLCDGTYLAVDNTHAHLNIPATFMWAIGFENRPIEITFDKPGEWKIATQLKPLDKANTFFAPNLDYFMDSPTELGPLQIHSWQITVNGKTYNYRIALHQDGSDTLAEAYAKLCKQIVREEIAIIGHPPDYDYGQYTFIADYLPYAHGDGMEHRNSTICTSRLGLEKSAKQLLGTITHEFFHSWNVERMRPASLQPFSYVHENMSGELWFAEGFTNYYEDLVMQRAGITSIDGFAENLTKGLNRVLNEPGRRFFSAVEMSMQAPFVDAGVSNDPKNLENTFISYYPFGQVIALALDLTLREKFSDITLDDFMRAMWKNHSDVDRPYNNEDLRKTLGMVCKDTLFANNFFRRFVYGKDLADYKTLLQPAGFSLQPAHPHNAWLGFAHLAFDDDQIIVKNNTRIGSPLYNAGVARDDNILSLDGETFSSKEDLDDFLKKHKPGDVLDVSFEKRNEKRSTKITLAANPEVKVLPFEQDGLTVNDAILKFRKEWFASHGGVDPDSIHAYCPKCHREFPYRLDFCPYDGEKLGLIP